MSKTPFDSFSKELLEELLAPFGEISINPTRTQILRLLSSWKVSIEVSQHLQHEERELAMALSQAFLEWEQKTEQRGLKQGLKRGLKQGRLTLTLNPD